MSVAPTSHPGKILLQPAYFTSSSYINALRNDIDALVKTFESELAETAEQDKPFTLFKTIWCTMGWQWLHFKVFDARSREMFLQVTCRMFMEQAILAGKPLARVVGLFGLYTFFNTQPSGAPTLYSLLHAPIPRDHHFKLLSLPDDLDSSLKAAAVNILRLLENAKVFFILPDSEVGTHYPRILPREVMVLETAESEAPKKKGRPSKADRAQKAQLALDNLDQWLQKTTSSSPDGETTHQLLLEEPTATLETYTHWKNTLLNSLQEDPHGLAGIRDANKQIHARLKQAAEITGAPPPPATESGPGIRRVERAMLELDDPSVARRGGLLALLEGAGNLDHTPMDI